MEKTLFELQGYALLLFEKNDQLIRFWLSGFDVLALLKRIPDIGNIKLSQIGFEGKKENFKNGNNYIFGIDDFKPVRTVNDLINSLNEFEDIEFYGVDFNSDSFNVHIYDNRDFTIDFNPLKYPLFFELGLYDLLSNCLTIPTNTIKKIVDEIKTHSGEYIKINREGEVMDHYKSFDDYLSANSN